MSPKIGLLLDVRSSAALGLRPIDRVRMAIAVCEAGGMKVALDGSHGVVRHRITGNWIARGPWIPPRVGPLGAVCVVDQPMAGDDVEAGAAEALEVSGDWLRGLRDGFEGEACVDLITGPSRELYLDGVRSGHIIFAEVTVECRECGTRRHRRDERCSDCP